MGSVAYLVLVIRYPTPAVADQVSGFFDAHDIPGTLFAPNATGAVVLVPAAEGLVDELRECLDGRAWCAVASRPRDEIPSGRQEAADVLALVLATRSAPGVYDLDDVLVQYAATRHDKVLSSLVAIAHSLRSSSVGYETLDALIRADYNRNRAARELFIHRTTLDYRLRRIEEITGYHPMTSRGARVLGAALTAYHLSCSA